MRMPRRAVRWTGVVLGLVASVTVMAPTGQAATCQVLTPAKPAHQAAAAYPIARTRTGGNGQRQGQPRPRPRRSAAATAP